MFEFDEAEGASAKIKVVGVGGGGGNAINTMISSQLSGVEFIAANTDGQALENSRASIRVQLGAALTKGLGAGANPDVGRNAALEARDTLHELLEGADMVFVTAGLGGGTGTGAAPIIADVAKECGALTVGVVTKPFRFEGKRRMRQSDQGIVELRKTVDTLITIPNERLLSISDRQASLLDAFKKVDEVLLLAVQGISDLITVHGLINLDFADVRTIMNEMGMAIMGSGVARGENRALEAARQAISSPLLEDLSVSGARGILINITGGTDLTLHEINEAATLIQEEAHEEANIIFGSVINPEMTEEVRVTVIATGLDQDERFDRTASVTELPRREGLRPLAAVPAAPPARPAPPPRAAAPAPPVAATPEPESTPKDDLPGFDEEIAPDPEPPKLYRPKRPDAGEVKKPARTFHLSPFDEDEYDIPTFLRRQAD
ncbi:MAG: cell division protein FtsZ [Deltaproteobacteria bacterium RBG_13_65_10]|nr:MAG: cell division protein FtsZ [Deltaproteobacteria bacterium RBG_13_65_10]